jgi:hypothetical protein
MNSSKKNEPDDMYSTQLPETMDLETELNWVNLEREIIESFVAQSLRVQMKQWASEPSAPVIPPSKWTQFATYLRVRYERWLPKNAALTVSKMTFSKKPPSKQPQNTLF